MAAAKAAAGVCALMPKLAGIGFKLSIVTLGSIKPPVICSTVEKVWFLYAFI